MDVHCDRCGRTFEPNLREVDDVSGGVAGVFDCPHCGGRYESYVIDRTGVRMRARMGGNVVLARLRKHVSRGRGLLPG